MPSPNHSICISYRKPSEHSNNKTLSRRWNTSWFLAISTNWIIWQMPFSSNWYDHDGNIVGSPDNKNVFDSLIKQISTFGYHSNWRVIVNEYLIENTNAQQSVFNWSLQKFKWCNNFWGKNNSVQKPLRQQKRLLKRLAFCAKVLPQNVFKFFASPV